MEGVDLALVAQSFAGREAERRVGVEPQATAVRVGLMDWVVLYSFLYWPTYLIGLGLMLFAIVKLKKSK